MKPSWISEQPKAIDLGIQQQALARQDQLTKPPGSLGRLEEVAVQLAGLQGQIKPKLEQVQISVFAGDHGVVEEGVSLFPQVVTGEMIKNFAHGGAAISVLARELGADLEVVDCGAVVDVGPLQGVVSARVRAGTRNLAREAAMSEAELAEALAVGKAAAERAAANGAQLFVAGDMGIGNTTPSTALLCAFSGIDPVEVTGPGTGLDAEGVSRKAEVINEALELHQAILEDPWQVLRHLGGLEIAAIAGAYIRCAQLGIAIVVDGFIASAAALCAIKLNAPIRDWMIFAHASAEPGHQAMMQAMDARPILSLDLRLGEGSGAALVVTTLRMAVALNNQMATFAEAGVSESD